RQAVREHEAVLAQPGARPAVEPYAHDALRAAARQAGGQDHHRRPARRHRATVAQASRDRESGARPDRGGAVLGASSRDAGWWEPGAGAGPPLAPVAAPPEAGPQPPSRPGVRRWGSADLQNPPPTRQP